MSIDWVFWGSVLLGMLVMAFLLLAASGLSE